MLEVAGLESNQPLPEKGLLVVTPEGKEVMTHRDARQELAALSGYAPKPRLVKWAVPVADVKFVEVSGIKEEGENEATVEFVYAWELNDLGKRLAKADPENKELERIASRRTTVSAIFERYDDGWRVTRIGWF